MRAAYIGPNTGPALREFRLLWEMARPGRGYVKLELVDGTVVQHPFDVVMIDDMLVQAITDS